MTRTQTRISRQARNSALGFGVTLLVAASGCRGNPAGHAAGDPASTAAQPPAAHVADTAVVPTAQGAAPSAAGANQRCIGTYKSEGGTLYVPGEKDVANSKEWSGVKWRGDDAGVGLGEGTLSFEVDHETGRIVGSGDGAIGSFSLSGLSRDGHLSASILPIAGMSGQSSAGAMGFTGTLSGAAEGEAVSGTMRLSLPNANVLRQATFRVTCGAKKG